MLKQLLAVLLVTGVAQADDWPHFRGPSYNGSSTEKNLPSKWSKTDNVAWVANLPGAAASTPIVIGDRVFVSTTNESAKKLMAFCLDRTSGKVLWRKQIGPGLNQDRRSNYAANSPAANKDVVVFFYGTGEMWAFTHEGKRLWSRNIQKAFGEWAFLWTFSTSPLIYEGRLYLQILQRDTPVRGRGLKDEPNESYLLAMDPKTGKLLFRHVRPSPAKAESLEAFSTPIPYVHEGRKEILILGGDILTSHDPVTGKELWRWGTWNQPGDGYRGDWRLVPSPVAGGGVILACAPKKSPIYAVKAGGTGSLGDEGLAWTSERGSALTSDVPTPAFSDGDFFILSKSQRTLSRVEPATAKVKWAVKMPSKRDYESSPLVADGKVYLMDFDALVTVVDAKNGKIISKIEMGKRGGRVRASIVASHGQLFIRTSRKLYCISKK